MQLTTVVWLYNSIIWLWVVISITSDILKTKGLLTNCCCYGDTKMDPDFLNWHHLLFKLWLIFQKKYFPRIFSSPFSNWVLRSSRNGNLDSYAPPLYICFPSALLAWTPAIELPRVAYIKKTVNICLPVAVATALFFLVLHPKCFPRLKGFRFQQRTTNPGMQC